MLTSGADHLIPEFTTGCIGLKPSGRDFELLLLASVAILTVPIQKGSPSLISCVKLASANRRFRRETDA